MLSVCKAFDQSIMCLCARNNFHLAVRLVGLARCSSLSSRTTDRKICLSVKNSVIINSSNRNISSVEGSTGYLKTSKVERQSILENEEIAMLKKASIQTNLSEPMSVLHNTVYTREIVHANDPLVKELLTGIRGGSRSALARAITLVESINPRKRSQGQALLREVLDDIRQRQKHSIYRVSSFRIGLSGPPGAGKSTHIEALGKLLTSRGHKVAVLAVDPSSSTTGGSLLGDKTRMPELSCDPNAYIRPSPAAGNLGGVTRVTNDAIVLCEGAGYDIILVETVGVGQSEFAVADMVDVFELIIPPAGGDELQGIKKGIVEVADFVVINKYDGDLVPAARRIQAEYTSALKFVRPKSRKWKPVVMGVSSLTKAGLPELWDKLKEFRNKMTLSGDLERRREQQHVLWMRKQISDSMEQLFNEHPAVKLLAPKLEFLVEKGALTPGYAADIMLRQFSSSILTAECNISQSVADAVSAAERQLLNELAGKELK